MRNSGAGCTVDPSPASEQAGNITQDLNITLEQVVVDLGFRGVDEDNPGKDIIHRGKFKSPSPQQKRWPRRRRRV
jgi:IS5 family transposase